MLLVALVSSGKVNLYFLRDGEPPPEGDLEEIIGAYHVYREFLELPNIADPQFDVILTPWGHDLLLEHCALPGDVGGCAGNGTVLTTRASLTHELAHLALDEFAPAPSLFSEGPATSLSCNSFNGRWEPILTDWRVFDDFSQLPEVEGQPYYFAGRFVASLIRRFGKPALKDFLALFDGEETSAEMEQMFLAAFDETLDDAWSRSLDPEFAQGCFAVAECSRPLVEGRTRVRQSVLGGLVPANTAVQVRLTNNFGIYSCDGVGTYDRTAALGDELGWVFSKSDVALVEWGISDDDEGGAVEVLQLEPGGVDPCVDVSLSLGLTADEDQYLVVMPPIEDVTLEIVPQSPSRTGLVFWLRGRSGYDEREFQGTWYRACDNGSPTELAPGQWPIQESRVVHLTEPDDQGPYIFEVGFQFAAD